LGTNLENHIFLGIVVCPPQERAGNVLCPINEPNRCVQLEVGQARFSRPPTLSKVIPCDRTLQNSDVIYAAMVPPVEPIIARKCLQKVGVSAIVASLAFEWGSRDGVVDVKQRGRDHTDMNIKPEPVKQIT
jgi:hypothetical protein